MEHFLSDDEKYVCSTSWWGYVISMGIRSDEILQYQLTHTGKGYWLAGVRHPFAQDLPQGGKAGPTTHGTHPIKSR